MLESLLCVTTFQAGCMPLSHVRLVGAILVSISELKMSCDIWHSLVLSEYSPLFVGVRSCLTLGQGLECRTREMAQWVTTPRTSLSSVLGAHIEGEN